MNVILADSVNRLDLSGCRNQNKYGIWISATSRKITEDVIRNRMGTGHFSRKIVSFLYLPVPTTYVGNRISVWADPPKFDWNWDNRIPSIH